MSPQPYLGNFDALTGSIFASWFEFGAKGPRAHAVGYVETLNRPWSLFYRWMSPAGGKAEKSPPSRFAQFTERVPMLRGRLERKASTATGYAWLVWLKDNSAPPRLLWVPPCRRRLERHSDYPGVTHRDPAHNP
jgi:hypothetical protein